MAWVQLHISTDPDNAELLESLLMDLGAVSVALEDEADQPLYEPDMGATPLWMSTRVSGMFEARTNLQQIREALAEQYHQLTQQPLGPVEVEVLEEKDWSRAWMDDFEPIRFGERLWICPSWHKPPHEDAVNLMLDPGLAFGTGTHPTTALCLRWLDSADLINKEVIDYGCGSGILGLAALLLGARQVTGVDNDPQALEASRENAQRNKIAPARLQLHLPENAPNDSADVLLANILAQPLLALAPVLAGRVKKGGDIVLSGILTTQAQQLVDHYSQWFTMDEPAVEENWVCLHGTRL
ncbi:50S ribosomal protein L11 methyltransferase [Hydrocarboniclastica marina]|uniref:Ribosomal protein L11 methyltransferase n=1 Tax=Hydrocarboniclastica marina TaxID=2259620 RepID=A0A4P7XK55_9ALTE|nr:50S ribosomal protein L11 methyltransferase [Hydrocarboniclastica marina]MAL97335.1 50S ribosomal protein L11 methyltransferase [Alteromonadaceae bacterium]QCF27235.1 50S ribosomal protein L11 methyltransferase [Hydrocarboniclastica marina]